MAPSGRVPRVPRTPGREGRPGVRTPSSEAAPTAWPNHAASGAEVSAHDAEGSPQRSAVTVRSASKVTLLNPAQDTGVPEDQEPEPVPEGPPAGKQSPKAGRSLLKPGGRRGAGRRGRDESDAGGAPADSADVLAFPEPPRKRRQRRILLGTAVAVALIAGLFAVLVFTPLVAVRTITVQGTHLLTSQQVEAALEPVRGRPLVTVGTDQVRGLVGQFVQVKSVRARAVPPQTLVVEIVERVPVALVKQDNKLLVVDGDGVVLGEARDTSQYAVPVIDGSAMPVGQAVFTSVTAVLAALPADVLAQLATASAQSADSVELKLSDGRTVVWGNADERELKAKVLAALMKAAQAPEKGQASAQVFDVSTPRHPVTR